MATADRSAVVTAEVPAAKVPLTTLLVCCLVTVVFAVAAAAGTMWYLTRGRKPAATSATAAKKDAVVATHPKALEPLLINLADEGGHAYLRLGVVLEEADVPGAKAKEEAKPAPGDDAAVRDTIFDVLGRQSSGALLAPDGKVKLKSDLMAAIAAAEPELHVKKIYFTDFLVQR